MFNKQIYDDYIAQGMSPQEAAVAAGGSPSDIGSSIAVKKQIAPDVVKQNVKAAMANKTKPISLPTEGQPSKIANVAPSKKQVTTVSTVGYGPDGENPNPIKSPSAGYVPQTEQEQDLINTMDNQANMEALPVEEVQPPLSDDPYERLSENQLEGLQQLNSQRDGRLNDLLKAKAGILTTGATIRSRSNPSSDFSSRPGGAMSFDEFEQRQNLLFGNKNALNKQQQEFQKQQQEDRIKASKELNASKQGSTNQRQFTQLTAAEQKAFLADTKKIRDNIDHMDRLVNSYENGEKTQALQRQFLLGIAKALGGDSGNIAVAEQDGIIARTFGGDVRSIENYLSNENFAKADPQVLKQLYNELLRARQVFKVKYNERLEQSGRRIEKITNNQRGTDDIAVPVEVEPIKSPQEKTKVPSHWKKLN